MSSPDAHQCDRQAGVAAAANPSLSAEARIYPVETEKLTRWLSQARTADTRALSRLLDALFAIVSRTMRGRLSRWAGAEDTANDIAQETVIRVANHIVDCRATDGVQLVSWTSKIAKRVLLDLQRSSAFQCERSWRSTDRDAEFALELVAASQWAAEQADEKSTSPNHFQAHKESAHQMASSGIAESASTTTRMAGRRVLMRIAYAVYTRAPDAVAVLLYRHLIDRATWAELGHELGTTAAGAKRRYQRAQATLRRAAFAELQMLPEAERRAGTALLASWGCETTCCRGRTAVAWSRQAASQGGHHSRQIMTGSG